MHLEYVERTHPLQFTAKLRGDSVLVAARVSHHTLDGLKQMVLKMADVDLECHVRIDHMFQQLAVKERMLGGTAIRQR